MRKDQIVERLEFIAEYMPVPLPPKYASGYPGEHLEDRTHINICNTYKSAIRDLIYDIQHIKE